MRNHQSVRHNRRGDSDDRVLPVDAVGMIRSACVRTFISEVLKNFRMNVVLQPILFTDYHIKPKFPDTTGLIRRRSVRAKVRLREHQAPVRLFQHMIYDNVVHGSPNSYSKGDGGNTV